MSLDLARAKLGQPDQFARFEVPAQGDPLDQAGLKPETQLLLVERTGERRALVLTEMAYHHAAQGELAGQPYLVTF
jgi:hypothetical protein